MNQVIIGIGSNIDPEQNIKEAQALIREAFTVIKVSRFRKTEPIGNKNQANFLNGAVLIKTDLNPGNLKKTLRTIEDRLQRTRDDQHGPRTIDLDIVVWNGEVVDPDVPQRDFLQAAIRDLEPWNSI